MKRYPSIHSDQRLVHRRRPLQRREMPAIGNDDEARAADAGGDLLGKLRRRQLIAVADQNQRRTGNGGKDRPRVGAGHDRLRLAQERLRPGFLGHGADDAFQRRIAEAVAVDEDRKQAVGDFGKAAGLGEFDQRQTGCGLRREFGADPRIEDGELRHALRRLAHDLERDVAAERKAGERKARRRRGENAARNRRHRVIAGVIGHGNRTEPPQRRNLLGVKPRRAKKSGNQHNRQTV